MAFFGGAKRCENSVVMSIEIDRDNDFEYIALFNKTNELKTNIFGKKLGHYAILNGNDNGKITEKKSFWLI